MWQNNLFRLHLFGYLISVIKVHKLPCLIHASTGVFSTSKSLTSLTLTYLCDVLYFDSCKGGGDIDDCALVSISAYSLSEKASIQTELFLGIEPKILTFVSVLTHWRTKYILAL